MIFGKTHDPDYATALAGKVLSYMLAPDYVGKDDDGLFRLHRKINENGYDLVMYLKWNIDHRIVINPDAFAEGFQKLLAPISKAITAGEVKSLREKVERQAEEITRLSEKVEDLKRYKDAYSLINGRKL